MKKYNAISFDAFTYTKTEFPRNWYKSIGIKETTDYAMISGSVKEALEKLENRKK
jgi:hypothetical protein